MLFFLALSANPAWAYSALLKSDLQLSALSRLPRDTLPYSRAAATDTNLVVKETDNIILEIERNFGSSSVSLKKDVFAIFNEVFDNSLTLSDQEAKIRNLSYFLKSDEIKASVETMDLYVSRIIDTYKYTNETVSLKSQMKLLQSHTKALKNAIALLEGFSFREKYNGLVEFNDTLKKYVDNRSQYDFSPFVE